MLALCDSVGRRLRRDGKTARVVTVQLVDNAFRRTSHQTTLPNPTNSTDRLYHVAVELMRQMWPARPVRLVGVSAEKTSMTVSWICPPLISQSARQFMRTEVTIYTFKVTSTIKMTSNQLMYALTENA